MNDLERQVRESTRRLAGPAIPRPMPSDIPRRVHRRRAGLVTTIGAAAIAVVLVVLALTTGATPRVDVQQPVSDPYASMPADWPSIRLTNDPTALLAGSVDGIPIRLDAASDAGDACVILTVPGEAGGSDRIRTCASQADSPVPAKADMALRVVRAAGLGELEANVGFVSMRTNTLEVSGVHTEVSPPLLPAPDGWDVRPFLFFPPPNLDGWLQALGTGGKVLTDTLLCGSARDLMGCFGTVEQFAAIPGSFTPAPRPQYGSPPGPEWTYLDPIVQPTPTGDIAVTPVYGGDFTPYVDIELPSPVVGKKIVVTYGTAGGNQFSVAIYRTDGTEYTNQVGEMELFWGRAHGADDPGVYRGGSGLPADIPPGQAVSLLLDRQHGSDGSGFQVMYGWTLPSVDHVVVRLDDGWTQTVPVQHAGPVDSLGWVLAFIPATPGGATPVTGDGQELSRWPLCVGKGATQAPTCPSWFHP